MEEKQYWSTFSLQHTPMLFRILSLFRFFTAFYAKYSLLIKTEFSQSNRLIWYTGQALTLTGSPKSNYIRSLLPLMSLITAILTKTTQEGGTQAISLSKRGTVLPASCSACPYGHQDDRGNRQSPTRKDFICSQISYKRPFAAAFLFDDAALAQSHMRTWKTCRQIRALQQIRAKGKEGPSCL